MKYNDIAKLSLSLLCAFSLFTPALATDLPPANALSISQLLPKIQKHQPGRVLEAEYDLHNQRPTYEVDVLTANGQQFELKLDAISGALLQRKAVRKPVKPAAGVLLIDKILPQIQQQVPGKILEIKYKQAQPPQYEAKVLATDGTVEECQFNASTGKLISRQIDD